MRRILFFVLLSYLLAPQVYAACNSTTADITKIGVLSHRGKESTEKTWNPTATYLNDRLPFNCFKIEPLDFDEINVAVATKSVDFILVNPGIYVNLEVRYRVSRLATMNNRRGNQPYNIFGGVIFTRSDHPDIHSITDIRGKSFMAVDKTSLGGFQMAWREFKAHDIDPYKDFTSLEFGGIHDQVVHNVVDGHIDAGTVRTDILERMIASGALEKGSFRIIHPQRHWEFPFAHSTNLYPEWPFSKLQHTSNLLAQDVAIALLKMPKNHNAAIKGNYSGWTVPLDYRPVHELFQELKLPPYQVQFTFWEAIKEYWYWAVIGLLTLLAMIFITIAATQRSRYLKDEKITLERQNRLILDSVGDGIYGVDINGNSTFINKAMQEITGWGTKELIGANQHDILHHTREDGSHHPRQECPVYLTFRDNKARFVSDDVFWKKDGSSFPVEYSSTPIRDEKGDIIGSVVVFRDITERKSAEKKLKEHQDQLTHVARLSTLGEIASGIAHELNQPLTAISTNARACVRMLESNQPPTERCADIVEKIASLSEKAGEIIRHIRHLAHKETSSHAATSVHEIIHNALELLENEIRQNNTEVEINIDEDITHIVAQAIQIEQVILNLVRNAIEAMKSDKVEIRKVSLDVTKADDNLAEIRVTDTGKGIAKEIIEEVFAPFVTTKEQGMGLGLSISYSIIEQHESMLHVESRDNEGASFYFTLPTAA